MLEIPVPPRELQPNIKVHFRIKAKKFLEYKTAVYRIAKQQERPALNPNPIHLFIDFHPPNANRRDADNALSSLKAAIDGIAMHWRIDDRRMNPITIRIAEQFEGGKVCIKYTQEEYVPIAEIGINNHTS